MKPISLIILLSTILLSCRNTEQTLPAALQEKYSLMGDSIVKSTFDTLRSALQQSLKDKGVEGAIDYCNINAYAITSLHAKDGIMIRRTAERYRNPGNAPDSMEKAIFTQYVSLLKDKLPLENVVLQSSGNIHYFKPIILQAMCRSCHGTVGTDIQPGAIEAIKKRYPSDMATGFSDGDLRGMWHIRFPRK